MHPAEASWIRAICFDIFSIACLRRSDAARLRLRSAGIPLLLSLLLPCCAMPPVAVPAGGCAAGEGQPMQVATLYFGRGLPGGGEVTDQDWLEFLDKVITPNLPDGYTVFDAFGDWRAPGSTRTAQERSKVLLVALRPGPEGRAALERVRQTYQAQFHQLLVGMTLMPGCGDF